MIASLIGTAQYDDDHKPAIGTMGINQQCIHKKCGFCLILWFSGAPSGPVLMSSAPVQRESGIIPARHIIIKYALLLCLASAEMVC